MTKIEQNTVIWPFILILWVGPTNFSKQGPPHLLMRPWSSNNVATHIHSHQSACIKLASKALQCRSLQTMKEETVELSLSSLDVAVRMVTFRTYKLRGGGARENGCGQGIAPTFVWDHTTYSLRILQYFLGDNILLFECISWWFAVLSCSLCNRYFLTEVQNTFRELNCETLNNWVFCFCTVSPFTNDAYTVV